LTGSAKAGGQKRRIFKVEPGQEIAVYRTNRAGSEKNKIGMGFLLNTVK